MPVPNTPWMDAMRRGDLAAAWALSDAALAARDPATRDDPTQPYHLRWVWDGRPLDGRHVLVRCYHGLGDTLQFARFLPALHARAASVTLETQPELLPLLAYAPGIDRLIPFIQHDPAKAGTDIEIMELPHALRLPPSIAPTALRVPAAPSAPGAIGLCWRAGGWDPGRDIPEPLLAPLLQTGRPLVSLQPGPAPAGFQNPAGAPSSIADTAALIAGLPMVVTVDTMVAHLAGTLGRPTWLLLQRCADWRWGEGAASAWYPSVRMLRQTQRGEWEQVVEDLAGVINSQEKAFLF